MSCRARSSSGRFCWHHSRMLNIVWVAFILIGFVAAFLQLLQGDTGVFARVLSGLFDSARTGFELFARAQLGHTGGMADPLEP